MGSHRAHRRPGRLVSPACARNRRRPIGLLAAPLGVQRGYDVHVLDLVTEEPKPALVRALGATYHTGSPAEACSGAYIVVECTGVGQLVFDVLTCRAPAAIVCLTEVYSRGRLLSVDAGALNREMLLENDVVFGSVNANAVHYSAALQALSAADAGWLAELVSRRVPLGEWPSAFEHRADDVKVIIEVGR